MISLGFATVENIFYVFIYNESDLSVALLRMFSAVPLHATCGVIMGYYAGEAKFDKKRQNLLLFVGVLGAVALHCLYDYFLFLGKGQILSFIALAIGIFYSFKAIKAHQENSPFKN